MTAAKDCWIVGNKLPLIVVSHGEEDGSAAIIRLQLP